MRLSTLVVTALFATLTVSVAHAETKWQKNHPARTKEAEQRANQRARIKQGVKDGQITKADAKTDRQAIRAEGQTQRAEAAQNPGGHLTPAEAKANEQTLRASSKNIYEQRHDGAAPGSSGAAPAPATAPTTGQ